MRMQSLALIFAIVHTVCPARAQSAAEAYANACRKAIGPIPAFSCADGAIVPITVNGKPAEAKPGLECDRPALLGNGPKSNGQCVANSRLLSLSTQSAQVAIMCRQKHIRSRTSMQFDEIDVVAHNPATGATCWFQALGARGGPVEGAHVPSPTDAANGKYWRPPNDVASEGCGVCHDAGPFVFSPFVGQVWNRMPVDPFGPYFHVDPGEIGFEKWPTLEIAPRDNACLGCHRIGTGASCSSLTSWMSGRAAPTGVDGWGRRFPGSHAMPPGFTGSLTAWNEIYGASVDQIRSCCSNPNQPACETTSVPRAQE
jgi:hypothetical protein